MEDVVLDIHNVTQIMNVDDVSKKLKSMVVDKIIEEDENKVKITFILDKNKGVENG